MYQGNVDMIIDHTPAPTDDELATKVIEQAAEIERLTNNRNYYEQHCSEFLTKIQNVKGIYEDLASDGEEITDTLREIARMLDISLTREVSVSVTVTFSGTATVPIDMPIDDIADDVSFSFDEGWNSDIEWSVSEDDQDWDIQENY